MCLAASSCPREQRPTPIYWSSSEAGHQNARSTVTVWVAFHEAVDVPVASISGLIAVAVVAATPADYVRFLDCDCGSDDCPPGLDTFVDSQRKGALENEVLGLRLLGEKAMGSGCLGFKILRLRC